MCSNFCSLCPSTKTGTLSTNCLKTSLQAPSQSAGPNPKKSWHFANFSFSAHTPVPLMEVEMSWQEVKFAEWPSITLASMSAGHPTVPLLMSPLLSWKVIFIRLQHLCCVFVFLMSFCSSIFRFPTNQPHTGELHAAMQSKASHHLLLPPLLLLTLLLSHWILIPISPLQSLFLLPILTFSVLILVPIASFADSPYAEPFFSEISTTWWTLFLNDSK